MKILEVKGDVTFYKEGDVEYQKFLNYGPFKVVDGSMRYKSIVKKNNYIVRYNLNGINGFSVWDSDTCLEDGFWVLEVAIAVAERL